MKWDKKRIAEFKQLEKLLREVRSIDSGSNATHRIRECIRVASKLNDTNWKTGRASFLSFLTAKCAEQLQNERDGKP